MSLPSPVTLNRVIATQRRVHSQHSKVRPAKVPFMDPHEDDLYYKEANAQRSPRPVTSNRPLTESRKDHLQTLLSQEKNKEKKERIQAVLIQRLATKYGMKFISLISFFVEEFLSTHDEITSSELNILEKEVQNAIRLKNIDEQTSARSARNNQTANQKNNSVTIDLSNEKKKSDKDSKLSIDTNVRPPSGKEWQVLQIYQAIKDEEQVQKEKELLKNQKLAFRNSLDKHMKESQQLSNIEKEIDQQYLNYVKQDIAKFEEEEKTKKMLQKKKHEEELKIRKAQIEEQKARLEEQRKEQEKIDFLNLQLAREKAKQEQDTILQQKLQMKEKLRKIKEENEENKKIKMAEKQREAELDFKLMEEYAAKLDRENAEREQAFLAKLKEMEIYAKKFENEGAGKIAKEEQIRFEQQLLREQQRKLDEDLRKEREKELQRKEQTRLANEENQRQLALRQQLFQQEKERDTSIQQHYKDEEKHYYQHQREQQEKRKKDQENYRHLLDVQREELSNKDINLTGITPIEKKLNASTLKQINDNPNELSKVLNRMKFTKA